MRDVLVAVRAPDHHGLGVRDLAGGDGDGLGDLDLLGDSGHGVERERVASGRRHRCGLFGLLVSSIARVGSIDRSRPHRDRTFGSRTRRRACRHPSLRVTYV